MTVRNSAPASAILLSLSMACGSEPGAALDHDAATHDAAQMLDGSHAPDAAVTADAAELGTIEACGATVMQVFSKTAINPPPSSSGVFNAADPQRHQELDATLRSLVAGDITTALTHAQQAAYQLCRIDDAGSTVIVIRPQVSGEGHAVIAWRTDATVPLIVEAPHAWHDVDTDIQTIEMFSELKARAVIVSGIYRCSSLAAGPCDGTTTGCTALPIPYTLSDAAHNVDMLFQTAHVAISESFSGDSVVSMHGFSYAGISVSNITRESPALDSLQVRLVNALTTALPTESITSCQDYTNAPYERRMCGDDNVQGRHLHGSVNACAVNTLTYSGRFVHVEQSRTVRGDQRPAVLAAFRTALGL